MEAHWSRLRLIFKKPAITSRQVMTHKDTYFLHLIDDNGCQGWGECGLFKGLSCDDVPDYEDRLSQLCRCWMIKEVPEWIAHYPSLEMGLSMALKNMGNQWGLPGNKGIETNGLVWMGNLEEMTQRAKEKAAQGFKVVKMKIGGLDFNQELKMLKTFRDLFPADKITLRLDANGAFAPQEAMDKLHELSRFNVHSIEQPIRAGQWQEMARICEQSPIPIALDEELIGLNTPQQRREMIETIKPHYVVIKPSLTGWHGGEEYVELASERNIGWWATSALESNLGLYGVALFVSQYHNLLPQGLGLGGLYVNNVPPLTYLRDTRVFFNGTTNYSLPTSLKWMQ